MNWKEDETLCERVLAWRADGMSFGAIAVALMKEGAGEKISRNQVAGFLHRNYVGQPVKEPVVHLHPPKKPKKVKAPRPEPVVDETETEPEPEDRLVEAQTPIGVTFDDLTFRSCRWPYGDVGEDDFRYCGQPREAGCGSYCAAHHGLAYRPRSKRTKKEADEAQAWRLRLLRLNVRQVRG